MLTKVGTTCLLAALVFRPTSTMPQHSQPSQQTHQYNQTEQDIYQVQRDYYAIPYAMQLTVLTDAVKAGQGKIHESPKAVSSQQATMADAESFEVSLSNITTGKTSDVASQKFTDFVTVPGAGQEIVHLTVSRPDQSKDDKYGSVKAQWGPPAERQSNAPDPSSLTMQDILTQLSDVDATSFNRYVAYTVTLRYQGQSVNYKAIYLFTPAEEGNGIQSNHQIVDLYLHGSRYSDFPQAYRPDRILVSSWRDIPALRDWLSNHTTDGGCPHQMNQLCCVKGRCAMTREDFDRKMSYPIKGTGVALRFSPWRYNPPPLIRASFAPLRRRNALGLPMFQFQNNCGSADTPQYCACDENGCSPIAPPL